MAIGISGKAMVLRSFFFYFWCHTCILNMLLLVLWNIEFCVSQVFNRYQAHFLCVCVFFLFSGRYRFVIHVSELMLVLMLSWCCVAYSFRLTYSLPTHTHTHTYQHRHAQKGIWMCGMREMESRNQIPFYGRYAIFRMENIWNWRCLM